LTSRKSAPGARVIFSGSQEREGVKARASSEGTELNIETNRGESKMKEIKTIRLRPKLAQELIATISPDKQRKFRDHHALKLSRAIERGEWRQNNDMFMFGPNGLGNGQHRCAAAIKANKSIVVTVAMGCTEDEIKQADQGGLPRRTDDILKYSGYTHATNLAAIINTTARDLERNRFTPSAVEALAIADANKESLYDSLQYWVRCAESRCPVEPSLVCAVHYVGKQVNREAADSFAVAVSDGTPARRGDPVWLLLKRFKENKERNMVRLDRSMKAALVVKAFNAWKDGKQIPWLRWSPATGEEFPEIK
jgi:hypothetical protein